ncbi:hypothetical protein DV096_14955 [Bradymonadaceae bacterium TMQ3]|uniref:START domain-containing protein n=1 Tax=Lujinxingia sediminis TaxID=2480984 RepID=A0ABY0CUP1_9DELT|nr:hypothetical protein DV096_14955 [Bradymonadaceae bacterium TMQ3]RVU46777.1 hypothetical protein EA187_06480 [Lujinxingia sediminis]TXC74787.1 hypothetical protein FRC91_14625 [Bradymonadales bacterium TMQ1]
MTSVCPIFRRLPVRLFPTVLTILLMLAFSAPATAQQGGNWEALGDSDGVAISRMQVEGSSVFAFRGEIVADVHIGKILTVFADGDQRRHWVDRYDEHGTLDRGELSERYWIRFGLPFPIKDRDYVLQTNGRLNQDDQVFIATIESVDDARRPENDCCVRAMTYSTYYRFEALEGERTRMIVEVHTDPKGLLPNWLVNRIQRDWPSKTLGGLIRQAKKGDQPLYGPVADWHTP